MQSHPVSDFDSNSTSEYALRYTANEHDRLIRQAERIAPVTARLSREPGIGPGDQVLDLGSGLGDAEVKASNRVVSSVPLVGVWSRIPNQRPKREFTDASLL